MNGALPLQIWSHSFCKKFDVLPKQIQSAIERKVDVMARDLGKFPHERLQGRPEFRLRIGDYRVLYGFDLTNGRVFLLSVGHRREIYKN